MGGKFHENGVEGGGGGEGVGGGSKKPVGGRRAGRQPNAFENPASTDVAYQVPSMQAWNVKCSSLNLAWQTHTLPQKWLKIINLNKNIYKKLFKIVY